MEQNTVILSLAKYDEMKTTIANYEKSHEFLLNKVAEFETQNDKLIKTLLETNIETYSIENYDIDYLTDFDNWRFGLKNKKQLKELIGEERMIEFIKSKKEEYEKECEKEEENDGRAED